MHALHKLKVIATYFYVQPSGCTDGDYWSEGEWQFICPENNVRNRLLFHGDGLMNRRAVADSAEAAFKHLYGSTFASVEREDRHDHQPVRGSWVNNDYVDRRRKAFGLPEIRPRT